MVMQKKAESWKHSFKLKIHSIKYLRRLWQYDSNQQ